jgi:hypothetical protein
VSGQTVLTADIKKRCRKYGEEDEPLKKNQMSKVFREKKKIIMRLRV